MGECPAEVVGGGHLLDSGVDGLGRLLLRPVRPVAPPHLIHHQRRVIAGMAHRGDPGARRHVIARSQLLRLQRQAQGLGELGVWAIKSKAAAHDLWHIYSVLNVINIFLKM